VGAELGNRAGVIAARAGHDVQLWARNADVVDSINRDHVNSVYLAGTPLPQRSANGISLQF